MSCTFFFLEAGSGSTTPSMRSPTSVNPSPEPDSELNVSANGMDLFTSHPSQSVNQSVSRSLPLPVAFCELSCSCLSLSFSAVIFVAVRVFVPPCIFLHFLFLFSFFRHILCLLFCHRVTQRWKKQTLESYPDCSNNCWGPCRSFNYAVGRVAEQKKDQGNSSKGWRCPHFTADHKYWEKELSEQKERSDSTLEDV